MKGGGTICHTRRRREAGAKVQDLLPVHPPPLQSTRTPARASALDGHARRVPVVLRPQVAS